MIGERPEHRQKPIRWHHFAATSEHGLDQNGADFFGREQLFRLRQKRIHAIRQARAGIAGWTRQKDISGNSGKA